MQLIMKNRTMPYLSGRFFDGISSGLFMMALPWVMLETPGMGPFVAMVALACTAISFFLTPLFSTLIDRHSRKSLLVIVQLVQSLTALLVLIAYWLGFDSNWLLAAAQLLFWVSSNLAWTTNNAFTQENYDPHEYAAISGKQEIILQGTTLGAGALGVVLLQIWGMLEFAAFAAAASGLSTLSYLVTPYRQKLRQSKTTSFIGQMKESKDIFTAQPRFYAFLLLSALSYPILTFLGKLVPIWFSEVGISGDWYAGYNIAFGLGSLMTGLFVAKLLKLASHQSTMLYSMAIASVMLIGMSFSAHPAYLLIFTLFFGSFNALNRIARTNWMHHTIRVEQRGRADGGLQMFATMAQSISYTVIAFLSHYGLTHYGFMLAAVTMIGAVLMMKQLNKRDDLAPEIVVQN
ncbi:MULTISPECIES: MFS transporter [Vibrio]|uniref:MFS transporter n=1 Tax=Vibrio TaxID=662 RepID=UPI0020750FE9|nr:MULTISPECIES: MFS transporter [Vibrio]USD34978.1 MFS transporter [Vibrio sp. SCSIO 43186]USD48044.1 MFS transporter [Vibrio sp. SCSIO 43145]USD72103.1 MFS transporter [Vibrio sp. SCSIO 43139]USD97775.1 MFS transporter [Vibrio coralliilyticus]